MQQMACCAAPWRCTRRIRNEKVGGLQVRYHKACTALCSELESGLMKTIKNLNSRKIIGWFSCNYFDEEIE
jgi:hypothetical protein